jgi:MFS-type transporter involved in bile tolerance (Atg22 family)
MIVLAGAPLPGLVVGGLACAWAIDRLGPRRVILLALAQAVVIALAVPWARAPILLYACAAVAGVATAPALAASVVLVANRARTGAVAETFGLYLLGSRFAALMAWLLCVLLLRGHGGPYAATLALGGLILLGLLLVQGLIPGDEPADPPGAAATPGSEAAAMASGRSR